MEAPRTQKGCRQQNESDAQVFCNAAPLYGQGSENHQKCHDYFKDDAPWEAHFAKRRNYEDEYD